MNSLRFLAGLMVEYLTTDLQDGSKWKEAVEMISMGI